MWHNVPFTFVSIRIRIVPGTWQMLNKYVLKDDGMNYYTGRTMVLKFRDLKTVIVSGHHWWLEFWESHFSRAQENKWVEIVKCIEKWFIFPLTVSLELKLRLRTPQAYFHLWVSAAWYTVIIVRPSKCVLREMMHSVTFVSKHSRIMVWMTVMENCLQSLKCFANSSIFLNRHKILQQSITIHIIFYSISWLVNQW